MKQVLTMIALFSMSILYAKENKNVKYNRSLLNPISSPKPVLASATTKDKIFIDFVGNGDIQKSFSDKKAISANTGLGVVFERYRGDNKFLQSFEFDLVVNVASTVDSIVAQTDSLGMVTNVRDFGTYMINPLSSKQATTLNAKLYFGNYRKYPLLHVLSGLQLKFCASNNLWTYNGTSKNVTGMLLRVGGFHEMIPDNKRLDEDGRSMYSVIIGFSYSLRTILSDLSSAENTEFRQKVLNGTDKIAFHGIEFNFGIKLKNICADVQIPILNNGFNSVDGLTNTQLITGIRFVGGFPLEINTKKKEHASASEHQESTHEDEE